VHLQTSVSEAVFSNLAGGTGFQQLTFQFLSSFGTYS
jgi:hypothetical protein